MSTSLSPSVADALSFYRGLTHYACVRCESEHALDGPNYNESWLVRDVLEYLQRRRRGHEYERDRFRPAELQSGQPGGPRQIDIAGYGVRSGRVAKHASLLLEVKLMLEMRATFAKEILADVLRVAAVKDRTTQYTQRLVLVVGRRACWDRLTEQAGGIVPDVCPLDRRRNWFTLGLTRYKRKTQLNSKWKREHDSLIEGYLKDVLPERIRVSLVGWCQLEREKADAPEHAMAARMWRVFRS